MFLSKVVLHIYVNISMIVIGNGESRKSINLNKLAGPKIGCNAIFRDYYTEYLVCVDRSMVKEAQAAGADIDRVVYTRSDWADRFKVYSVPALPYKGAYKADDPFNWGSGPYAVLLAASIANSVLLLGFDLYSTTGFTNNVYKDTINYKNSNARAVDPRYWIYQIAKVFECFPNTQFKIYQTDEWVIPDSWKKSNVAVDKISNIV